VPDTLAGEPEDVAYWIVALADPAANWVTGQTINVDGGWFTRIQGAWLSRISFVAEFDRNKPSIARVHDQERKNG